MILEKQYMYVVIHRPKQVYSKHTLQLYRSNHCITKIGANSAPIMPKKHMFALNMFNTSLFMATVAELLLSPFGKTNNRKRRPPNAKVRFGEE